MNRRPQLRIRADLGDGRAVVAACHAALAWQLRVAALGLRAGLPLPFVPDDIERVPAEALEVAPQRPHLVMTESTLGGALVAQVVGAPGDVVVAQAPELAVVQVDPARAAQLRMYVLLTGGVALPAQLAAAATAVVQCFLEHKDDPLLRQWCAGVFTKTVCRVGPGELERALREPGRSVVADAAGTVVAVAFCPRVSWARCFRFFPLYRDPEW